MQARDTSAAVSANVRPRTWPVNAIARVTHAGTVSYIERVTDRVDVPAVTRALKNKPLMDQLRESHRQEAEGVQPVRLDDLESGKLVQADPNLVSQLNGLMPIHA